MNDQFNNFLEVDLQQLYNRQLLATVSTRPRDGDTVYLKTNVRKILPTIASFLIWFVIALIIYAISQNIIWLIAFSILPLYNLLSAIYENLTAKTVKISHEKITIKYQLTKEKTYDYSQIVDVVAFPYSQNTTEKNRANSIKKEIVLTFSNHKKLALPIIVSSFAYIFNHLNLNLSQNYKGELKKVSEFYSKFDIDIENIKSIPKQKLENPFEGY